MNEKVNAYLKRIYIGFFSLALSGCSAFIEQHPVGNLSVPEPKKPVDLNRYLGTWYEIARYEQVFQKNCDYVTADYSLKDNGDIKVVNSCRMPNGKMKQAVGNAVIVDDEAKNKLKVSFFGPFYGNYWVLDRGENYEWAIVGEPSGRYLWILSRRNDLTDYDVNTLYYKVDELGYNIGYLRRTKH